jgi:type VI secretion system secreted protein VgrG
MPGDSALRFYPDSGQVEEASVVSRFQVAQATCGNAVSFREWNFERPRLDLAVAAAEKDPQAAPAPAGMLLEHYAYPHRYSLQRQGNRYAQLELARTLVFVRSAELAADTPRLLPGHGFTLSGHPRDDANAAWRVVAAEHAGEQPGVLEHESPEGRGFHYECAATAIPASTRFVPALEHPKCRIDGEQAAIVTGPEGEEIFTDSHGRVKVRFFWDRSGKGDDSASCWVRVAQGWAGAAFGRTAIPRIGHEVLVTFMEGDPDRPLVTGRMFHALNLPPYALPEHKSRSVFKSLSSPGGAGFNEIHFEDRTGQEAIYIHAEKDVSFSVEHDWKESVRRNRHRSVGRDSFSRMEGEDHQTVGGSRRHTVGADHLTVHGDSHTGTDGNRLVAAAGEIHLESLHTGVIESGLDLVFKVGGNCLRINNSGVLFEGAVSHAASAGGGLGAKPLPPEGGERQEDKTSPAFVEALRRASSGATAVCEICAAGKKS